MGHNDIPDDTGTSVTKRSDKKFPGAARHLVAVDTALLTVDLERKHLLVVESQRTDTGKWVLPGTLLLKDETLASAVERCLREKLGVVGIHPQRLGVLDDPDRDDRGERVISVAHVAVVRPEQLENLGQGEYPTRLMPVDRPGELMWDHPEIVRWAKNHVRTRYEAEADPDRLLDRTFTLPELQQVHDAVAGEEHDIYRFRRWVKNRVAGIDDYRPPAGNLGRPARLFRRKRDGQ